MRLIDNWREAWRWMSVNCMALAGAIQGAWIYTPDEMRQSLPQHTVSVITIALLILGVVGRITTTKERDNGTDPRP